MINRCPRFDRCGASLCPFTMEGSHLEGEPICEYLRMSAKGCPLPEQVAEAIEANMPDVIRINGDIRRRLKRAATCPQRGANLRAAIASKHVSM